MRAMGRGVWQACIGAALAASCTLADAYDVPSSEVRCDDGVDDDLDGRVDCADQECATRCEDLPTALTLALDFGPIGPATDVRVCVLDRPELGCATTDVRGEAALVVPAYAAVVLSVRGPTLFPTLQPLRAPAAPAARLALTLFTREQMIEQLPRAAPPDATRAYLYARAEPAPRQAIAGWVLETMPPPRGEPLYLESRRQETSGARGTAVVVYDAATQVDHRFVRGTATSICTRDPTLHHPAEGLDDTWVRAPVRPGFVTRGLHVACTDAP